LTLLLSISLVAPTPAEAHLVNTGIGPFYDGLTHLFVTPEDLLQVIAILIGLLNGGLNGIELAKAQSSGLVAAGIACAIFVVVSIFGGQVTSVRALWARIAVRVAGSWIAASGLFMLGWAIRGGWKGME